MYTEVRTVSNKVVGSCEGTPLRIRSAISIDDCASNPKRCSLTPHAKSQGNEPVRAEKLRESPRALAECRDLNAARCRHMILSNACRQLTVACLDRLDEPFVLVDCIRAALAPRYGGDAKPTGKA